ncbi:MAG: hypothetical protein IPJ19_19130 [Planctomycetes bacterium]|nr:hypothetical protein [Planctomycetota bacterium]
MLRPAFAAILVLSCAPVALGQCPMIDTSFTAPPAGLGLEGTPSVATSYQGQLVAGASWIPGGAPPSYWVASFDGSAWHPFASMPSLAPSALRVLDLGAGPELYLGLELGPPSTARVPVYRWTGTSWSLLATGPNTGQTTGRIRDLLVYDEGAGPRLFAIGEDLVTAQITQAQGILRWDGSAWTQVGAGLPRCDAACVHDDGSGPALFVADQSTVRKWDGSSWTTTGLVGFPALRSLASYDDGNGPLLYAAGAWTPNSLYHGLARWDGSAWQPVPGVSGDGYSGPLAVFDDGSGARPSLWVLAPQPGGGNRVRAFDGTSWSPTSFFASGYPTAIASLSNIGGPDALFLGTATAHVEGTSVSSQLLRACEEVQPFCSGDGTEPVPCPCWNYGSAGRGCENSSTTGGALLTASGATHPDSLVLHVAGTPATALCVFAQGSTPLTPAVMFGDGVRCIGGSIQRLYAHNAVAGATSAPGPGELGILARSAALGAPIAPGSVRVYQVYYRDPSATFCPVPFGGFMNLSNAMRVRW